MCEPKARGAPGKRKKPRRRQELTARQIAYLGTSLAKQLGFQPLSVIRTARMLGDETITPLLFQSDTRRLWIDKLYIAVEDRTTLTLTYAYVTRQHIDSETRDDRAARKRGHGFLDAATKTQFAVAKREMKMSASQCALRGTRDEESVCGVGSALDLEASWYCP